MSKALQIAQYIFTTIALIYCAIASMIALVYLLGP